MIIALAITCFSLAESGWPDFIRSAYYDSKHHSIWYIKEYYDGGGGIEIIEYTINNHDKRKVTNIQGMKHRPNEVIYNGRIFEIGDIEIEKIEKLLIQQWLKKLAQVHIDKMPLYFTLTAYRYELYTDTWTVVSLSKSEFTKADDSRELYRTIRKNKIYVNGLLQNINNITTCSIDPINYRWLSLPWSNFVAIIVTSESRDCTERWYVGEEIFVVKYLKKYKKYFTGPHSDLYRQILEDNRSQDSRYNDNTDPNYYDTHDYFGDTWPLKPSIGWFYTNKLKYNKENIIKK